MSWPDSDGLDWPEARAAMNRGWDVVARHVQAGESKAHDRLEAFLGRVDARYGARRDLPADPDATSGLSDALAVGEISARRLWHRALHAQDAGRGGIEDFLRELAWRDFARDLFDEAPAIVLAPSARGSFRSSRTSRSPSTSRWVRPT